MSDKYGYIGIETLLAFCSNQKDHCVTPNDFMRMERVKIDERPHGEWVFDKDGYFSCSRCKRKPNYQVTTMDFCPNCGADNRPREKRNCDNCLLSEGEQCDILVPSENCKYWKPKFERV